MDPTELLRAREKFNEASVFCDELAAKSTPARPRKLFSDINPDEIHRLWSAFLVAFNTSFDRLLTSSGKGSQWAGNIAQARRTDPLLAYIQHARNVELHGLKPTTIKYTGSTTIIGLEGPTLEQPIGRIRFDIVDPHIQLVAVTDRNVSYPVPTTFRGHDISEARPVNVALLGLFQLEEWISQAENLLSTG